MRYWILILILATGCRSAEKIAERRQAREDERMLRQHVENIRQADLARRLRPCITMEVRPGVIERIPGAVIRCPDGTEHRCPDSERKVDTLPIIDMSMVSAARDSLRIEQITTEQLRRQASALQQQIVQLSAEKASQEQRNEELQAEKKKESRQKWITWGILIALAAGSITFSVAKKFIKP